MTTGVCFDRLHSSLPVFPPLIALTLCARVDSVHETESVSGREATALNIGAGRLRLDMVRSGRLGDHERKTGISVSFFAEFALLLMADRNRLEGDLANHSVGPRKSASSTGRCNTCLQFTGRGLEL